MSVSDLILFSTGPYILASISGAYVLGRMIKGVDLRLLGTKTLGISNARIYVAGNNLLCLLYTSPSPRDGLLSRMPSSA